MKETIQNPWYSQDNLVDPNEKATFVRSLADKIGWIQLCLENIEECKEGASAPILIDPCGIAVGYYCPATFCNDTMSG